MDTNELLKRVRKIEIKSRGLSNHIFAGEYHSAFKGRGMAFSEVREYQYGDDFRSVDWNVTARFNHPYIKVFEEERELTVMLLIDVSGSGEFGTRSRLKEDMITEIAAVLSFSAIQNNDKVGVILFSDRIEGFIPPKKGRQHILRIIRELIDFKPQSRRTDITVSLRYLVNVIKKRSTSFLISDFLTENYEDALKIAGRKHDLVGLWIYDIRERELPGVGLIKVRDAETGKIAWVNSSSIKVRNAYQEHYLKKQEETVDLLNKNGVDYVQIATHEDYVKPLMRLFNRRAK
ncbi:MAG TPA: DUF58 domain-containing protein [Bacteroidales bacterium]|jgi:uncharacterized protein (DUF58 family)|nr:DUF58 domain-containing protein [Bacteroidales bacterium]